MNVRDQMDSIYQDLAPDEFPWNLSTPPDVLVELVESRLLLPCSAVDLGCGAGNYAVWLAGRGFQMTGVDISPEAIRLAERLASSRGVACRFVVADIAADVEKLEACFDFAYDWEVVHHVFPQHRRRYIASVHRLLRQEARYLSVSFSEDDPAFGGMGKYRTTPLGTTLYFSSEQELRELFESFFEVEELCSVEVAGKHGPHVAIKALMTKKR
jgi:SAM-dependent methyltransferase